MSAQSQPIGYSAIIERFGLRVLPHHVESVLLTRGDRKTVVNHDRRTEFYPKSYAVGDSVGGHLEFALKHEGLNLEIFAETFARAEEKGLAAFIRKKPTGKYARKIWFLFEWLTGRRLPLKDLAQGSYVDLLDSSGHFCGPPEPSRRHRVNMNLLGGSAFCPLVRRTERLIRFAGLRLEEKCRRILRQYPSDVLERALAYLFTKETKSSFEIERVSPDKRRLARFVELLKLAERKDFADKTSLIELQRATVDARFAQSDWRTDQNYVGETLLHREIVHFIPPKPEDVSALMTGLFEAHRRLDTGKVHPVVAAVVVAFGFVFIHPFDDGNGRIHRFLIHNVLARSGFTPEGFIFPVSATMLRKSKEYDRTLELFSKPLLPLIEYDLDEQGKMTVLNETANRYRFPDMTAIAEALFGFVEETLKTELIEELDFIQSLDRAKKSAHEIVDMPDRLLNLFIQTCLQNQGRLSKAKRKSLFCKLTDREIGRLEKIVASAFGPIPKDGFRTNR